MSAFEDATIVVVHGAWADGSSWEPVIRRLQHEGLNIIAAPIPLTSLSDDAAMLRRTIARTQGPVIVAGHAYAGAVVGTANGERVKALVYIAALAPDERETVAECRSRTAQHRTGSQPGRITGNVLKLTLDRYGRVDALLNIAGAVPQIDLFEMTDEQWYAGMELKLHGARRLTIRAWDALKVSKGSVVFMSGSAALDPKPGFAAVAATNAAIIAMAKAFAEQGIKDGVQVNSIVPRGSDDRAAAVLSGKVGARA